VKKVWYDPVWSKVIANGICALLAYALSLLPKFRAVLTFRVPVPTWVFLAALSCIAITVLLYKLSKTRKSPSLELQPSKENLRIELLEGFVGWRKIGDSIFRDWAFVFIHVRVSPISGRPLSIKEWKFFTLDDDGNKRPLSFVRSPNVSKCAVMERGDIFGPTFDILPILVGQSNSLIPDGAFADYYFLVGGNQEFLCDFFKLSFKVEAKDTQDYINTCISRAGGWLKIAQFS